MKAFLASLERAFADACDRQILRWHQPTPTGVLEPPYVVCTNHWSRALPWPCPDVRRAANRMARR